MKWTVLSAALLLAGCTGAQVPTQETSTAEATSTPREERRDTASREERRDEARAGTPLYNGEDLLFLRHMSIHHQQALDMAALVPARTEREEFIRFARYVDRGQQAEIESMESLLDLAAGRGLEVPEHGPHGDPVMPGMLSSGEMAALEAASGPEFERLWLEGMIFHHEGALAMARAQQLQQLQSNRRPYGFHVLVEDILVEQRAEIIKMGRWLEEWGLTDDGDTATSDTRGPAIGMTSPPPGVPVSRAPLTLIGTAIDETDVTTVRVAIQDTDTGQWWQGDGAWGPYRDFAASITRSGPSSMAWQFDWTPPASGRYGIRVVAEDPAGNQTDAETLREMRVR